MTYEHRKLAFQASDSTGAVVLRPRGAEWLLVLGPRRPVRA